MVAIFTSNVTKSKSGDCSEVWCLVCIISVSGMLVGSFLDSVLVCSKNFKMFLIMRFFDSFFFSSVVHKHRNKLATDNEVQAYAKKY